MAKTTSLKYPVYAKATETASDIAYASGAVLAKAISAKIAITTNDEKLFADDAICESDRSFSDGKVNIGIDDLYDSAKVDLLAYIEGAVIDAGLGSKELTVAGGTSGVYVGFGFYGRVKRNGATRWRAIWLKKVQFAEPSDEFETKGEKTGFKTAELEGTIMVAADGNWKSEATFSTEAACKAWLDGKCGLATTCALPVSSVATGTYSAAQSVTLTSATSGAAIYYTVDGTIPSATNGALYSTAIACAKPSNKCIKAVSTKDGNTNSAILELYITVTA